jgi:hypothetical protein
MLEGFLHKRLDNENRSEIVLDIRSWRVRIAMQLLELIDYGPNTFKTHERSGEDSENIDENVR